jgi:hypothetical protein
MTNTPTSSAESPLQPPPQPLPLKEVAELLVKHYGLREGLWELALEMQVGIGQFGATPDAALPGAAFGVSRVGLARVAVAGPRTVNAAEISSEGAAAFRKA